MRLKPKFKFIIAIIVIVLFCFTVFYIIRKYQNSQYWKRELPYELSGWVCNVKFNLMVKKPAGWYINHWSNPNYYNERFWGVVQTGCPDDKYPFSFRVYRDLCLMWNKEIPNHSEINIGIHLYKLGDEKIPVEELLNRFIEDFKNATSNFDFFSDFQYRDPGPHEKGKPRILSIDGKRAVMLFRECAQWKPKEYLIIIPVPNKNYAFTIFGIFSKREMFDPEKFCEDIVKGMQF